MFEAPAWIRRLALAGIVGPIAWWVLVAVNGAITPGYSHVADFISTLGGVGAPYAALQVLNFAVLGGSILAVTLGIHAWFDDGRRPRVGTVLLGIFGVGVVLAGVFPQDLAAPDSTTNRLHDVTSTIAFVTGIGGISLLTRRIRADDRWPSYRYELGVTVVVVLVTFVVFMAGVAGDSTYVGLTQRLFVGAMTVWIVVQAYRLYRLAGDSTPREAGSDRPASPGRRTVK